MNNQSTGKININYIPSLATLIVVIILSACYWFIFQPVILEMSGGGKLDLSSQQKRLEVIKAHLADQKKLIADYGGIAASDKEKINKILPSEKEIPALFGQLEDLAHQNSFVPLYIETYEELGLKGDFNELVEIKRKLLIIESGMTPSLPEDVGKITLNFKMTDGSYRNLKDFLVDLENSGRLLDITSINYHQNLNSYELSLDTYYMKGKSI